jgi:cytidylate kinase
LVTIVSSGILVVSIDGPAGAGKSTIARALAKELGVQYLDTGAMYRAVTAVARLSGIDVQDEASISSLAERMTLDVGLDLVLAEGNDVTSLIRSPEVTSLVSIVAAFPRVRAEMRRRQRQWGEARGGGVIEGRDIGTVVFPDAVLKVFLTASPRIRATRRVEQAGGDIDEVERQIIERDRLDSTRADSPLRESTDCVVIDTSNRSIEDVVGELLTLLQGRPT